MDSVVYYQNSKIYKANKEIETMESLKLAFYNMAADFYLRLSSRHLTKATLLNDKAEAYIEKQKAIKSVLTKNN